MRLTLALALVALAPLVAAPAALAHASLVRSEPAAGEVLRIAPRVVRLVFDDAVSPAGGEAIRNGGRSVIDGAIRLEPGNDRVVLIPLRPRLPRGDYSVRWQVLSDDGHVLSGVLAFGVGAGRASPTATLSAASSGPGAWGVASRFLLLTGIACALGAVAFRGFGARSPRLVVLAAAGFAFAAAALVPSLFADDAEAATRFGRTSVVGALVALAGILFAMLALAGPRLMWPLVAAAAVAVAAIPSVRGHALDSGHPRALNLALDLAHVLVAAFWAGGAAAALVVRDAAARRRWVEASVVLLPVLVGTGVARGFFELSSPADLWTSGYGRSLLVKSGLLVLAVAATAWGLARLAAARSPAPALAAQVSLLTGVLLAVGFLTDLRPGAARTARPQPARLPTGPAPRLPADALVLAGQDDSRVVALAVTAGRLTATVLDANGRGLGGLEVGFAAGGRTLRAAPCRPGCYRAPLAGPVPRRVVVAVDGPGLPGARVGFALPAWPPRPAEALVRRAARAVRALHSVAFDERLASSDTQFVRSSWRLQAPNRFSYAIPGSERSIVIGDRRWTLESGGRWVQTDQSPQRQPQPPWGDAAGVGAYVVGRGRGTLVAAFADRDIPAWYRVTIERRSGRVLAVHMVAPSHFMVDRFHDFNAVPPVTPPPSK